MRNIDKRIKSEAMVSSMKISYTTLMTEDMMLILSGDAVIRIPASWYQSNHSIKRTFFSRKSDRDAIRKIAQFDISGEFPKK